MSVKTLLKPQGGENLCKSCSAEDIIDFKPITPEDRELYNSYLFASCEKGCENSFANVFMWGESKIATVHKHLVRLARFGSYTFYSYPLGTGDKTEVINALIKDACARNIPFTMGGITPYDKEQMEEAFPCGFSYVERRNSFDYVYEIDALATLPGKKYHSKRNHCARFSKEHPDYRVVEISEDNIHLAVEMSERWYKDKEVSSPEIDFEGEKAAIKRAFESYFALGLEGIMLLDGNRVLALTVGNRMSYNTFDINFEKAEAGVNGAYAAVNKEFASYLKEKYPEIEYLNREEDMGLEGLRKAKESYYPHHMVVKHRAYPMEDADEN